MKAKDLIKILQEDPERIVVLSKDGEGNGFSPLADVNTDHVYKAENTWSGVIGPAKLTKEMEERGYGEEDVLKGGKKCFVLWPTN